MRLFAGKAQRLTLRMHVSVDCMIQPPEQKPGTRVKAHNERPDIASHSPWIREDDPTEVGCCIAGPMRPQ
jgi:hypothetical protein